MKHVLPLIVADACGLLPYTRAELAIDYQLPHDPDTYAQPQLGAILGQLTSQGRTMVITRRVFNELFPTANGRLDFAKNDQGEPVFPLGMHHSQLTYANAQTLYNALADCAQAGKIRCYAGINDMIAAGEVDDPKGGIVIVDTASVGEQLPLKSEGVKRNKKQDYFEEVYQPDMVSEHKKQSAAKWHNSGDKTILDFVQTIGAYRRAQGLSSSMLVITGDGGLTKDLIKLNDKGIHVPVARSYEVLFAMQAHPSIREPLLPGGVAERYTNALSHLKAQKGERLLNNVPAFVRSVNRITHWLDQSVTEYTTHAGHRERLARERENPVQRVLS